MKSKPSIGWFDYNEFGKDYFVHFSPQGYCFDINGDSWNHVINKKNDSNSIEVFRNITYAMAKLNRES